MSDFRTFTGRHGNKILYRPRLQEVFVQPAGTRCADKLQADCIEFGVWYALHTPGTSATVHALAMQVIRVPGCYKFTPAQLRFMKAVWHARETGLLVRDFDAVRQAPRLRTLVQNLVDRKVLRTVEHTPWTVVPEDPTKSYWCLI